MNTKKSQRTPLPESLLLYYSAEVCNVVDTLHQLGIIHADIKPDNFMIRDIRLEDVAEWIICLELIMMGIFNRSLANFQSAKGKGVCLIDFGRAIDTKLFPEDQLFVGSSDTEGFQCGAMLEGKPWKWQVPLGS